jgi:two-component system, OmpR family, response regulator
MAAGKAELHRRLPRRPTPPAARALRRQQAAARPVTLEVAMQSPQILRLPAPILVLTARGSWSERVEGIDAGADDYLPKPFHVEELVARLGAITRRSGGQVTPILQVGDIRIDTRRMDVSIGGRNVDLSPLEFRALRYLVHNKGRVVSQGELSEHVYSSEAEPDSNALEVLVGRLRRKMGATMITTRRGYGYVVDDPVRNP